MKKKLSYMITIMLAFTLSLALGLFFNSAHADSLPQKDGANQKTTKVTVSNKDVPNAVRKLAEEQYLSRVALLDKLPTTKQHRIHLVNLLKFINLIRKATAIIIIQCSIKKEMSFM